MDPELKEKLRKFRFRKETDNAAIISECHSPLPYPPLPHLPTPVEGWEGVGDK